MVYHKEAEFHNDLTTSSTACDDYQFLSLSLYTYIYIYTCMYCSLQEETRRNLCFPLKGRKQQAFKQVHICTGIYIHSTLQYVKKVIPSGRRLQIYGKSPCLMGKSTINGHFQ